MVLSIVDIVWVIAGTFPGLVFLIIALTSKNKSQKTKFLKWAKIGLGGIAFLLVLMVAYFLVSLIATIMGVPLNASLK